MTVLPGEIGWSGYREWEGPFFGGRQAFVLPKNPTEDDKLLAVVAATEGKNFDQFNGYDRCIITVGLCQWCEASNHNVQNLLGFVTEQFPEAVLSALVPALSHSGAQWNNDGGKWRFRVSGVAVESEDAKRRLFHGGASGKKGEWTDRQKETSRIWAAALASVWEHKPTHAAQRDWSVPRLHSFAWEPTKRILWDGTQGAMQNAMRAAYLSFAANLPAVASKQLAKAVATTVEKKWSLPWVAHVLKTIAFGARIDIWPMRWAQIRPVIETLYGVELPRLTSTDYTPKEIQARLRELGHYKGAIDGHIGPISKVAIQVFQRSAGLVSDGIAGPMTIAALFRR